MSSPYQTIVAFASPGWGLEDVLVVTAALCLPPWEEAEAEAA